VEVEILRGPIYKYNGHDMGINAYLPSGCWSFFKDNRSAMQSIFARSYPIILRIARAE
jgi:hypothetical protein